MFWRPSALLVRALPKSMARHGHTCGCPEAGDAVDGLCLAGALAMISSLALGGLG
jgi:hypothetical protein